MRFVGLCPWLLSSLCLMAEVPDPNLGAKPLVITAPSGPKAEVSDPDRFSHLPRLFLDDAGHVISAPGRWERSDWITAGVSTAAVLGTALLLDRPMDQAVQRNANGSWDRGARAVQQLGGTPSVLIAGGTYLAGVAFKEPEVRATGVDAMVTMGVAQLLLALPLKEIVGRSRPYEGQGSHDFHPFGGGNSFPSGHTVQAFALASVISEHADRPWVTGLSYGLAGMVAMARVELRQHFLSDVVAGGLIGTFVGKTVVSYNQSLRANSRFKASVSFAPSVQQGGYGITIAMKF